MDNYQNTELQLQYLPCSKINITSSLKGIVLPSLCMLTKLCDCQFIILIITVTCRSIGWGDRNTWDNSSTKEIPVHDQWFQNTTISISQRFHRIEYYILCWITLEYNQNAFVDGRHVHQLIKQSFHSQCLEQMGIKVQVRYANMRYQTKHEMVQNITQCTMPLSIIPPHLYDNQLTIYAHSYPTSLYPFLLNWLINSLNSSLDSDYLGNRQTIQHLGHRCHVSVFTSTSSSSVSKRGLIPQPA